MRPPGTSPGSRPSIRIAYGTTTITSDPSAIRLSTRIARDRVRLASSSPAVGMAMKAIRAAYRWMPPASESESPGLSVGKAPTISRQPDQSPTSSAALRSSRARPIPSTDEPTASSVSATGSSQPCEAQAYSLIMSRIGLSPDTACSSAMAATPSAVIR
ncbi:hypothetical protein Acor_18070 [Acrocarpospora corrugata]|uniref:Uncharacterized protein n=1 Tax=Acrocarpospora corrugata TaxID=35763 RepID=A0A5M3VT85_9ACTN|nr:hypothetical protein [Acrocarpospora corrugata]GER99743.1 hypothetical protein Acor_18070 [Acrocarpospora corrugata]